MSLRIRSRFLAAAAALAAAPLATATGLQPAQLGRVTEHAGAAVRSRTPG